MPVCYQISRSESRKHEVTCLLSPLIPAPINLKASALYGPARLAYQNYGLLQCATYSWTKTLLWWFADQLLQTFDPPDNGLL